MSGDTAGDDATPGPSFYRDLSAAHEDVVPVVGSGLSLPAGAPGFSILIEKLLAAAKKAGISPLRTVDDPPFEVVDELAASISEDWVRYETAAVIESHEVVATPALCALAKVATGLIVTTNYDLAIECAATTVGRPVQTLMLEDLEKALTPPGRELRVLHLHGIAANPSSIVLTSGTYDGILGDERAQLLLRDLAIRYRLVFLGHALAPRETHMRRDIDWALRAIGGGETGRHLLITDRRTVHDPESVEFKADIEAATGIRVAMFPDPDRAFEASIRAAHVIAGPSRVAAADVAPVLRFEELDPHYVPLPMADADELSTPNGRGAHLARTWQQGEILAPSLDETESRLVLVAGGGTGKSEELRQIAMRTHRPALLATLTMFDVDDGWGHAGTHFVTCMHAARAVERTNTPALTLDRLKAESYVFLLDSLDEVSAARRPAVARLISEVASSYPQHRFVVGSRPVPEVHALEGFARWTPVPDRGWLSRYAERRAVTIENLESAVLAAGNLDDLIQIPIFAAAAIDELEAGRPLPANAIELVWHLADSRTGDDRRIAGDPRTLRVWLDRLALLMELARVSELSHRALAESGLHEDLEGLAPTEELLARLAARALLTDAEGTTRFPANVIAEARAGRALVAAGDEGLEMMKVHVLVELPTRDSRGAPVRAIQPSWTNTLELLLPVAPPNWRDVVAEYDAMLVARATATDAPVTDRQQAIWTIWRTYRERLVWLERGAAGHGTGDSDALIRLLKAGPPDGFADEVVKALSDPEPTVRGNAIQVLPATLGRDDALDHLANVIGDDDPVVRRQAAAAAYSIGATELVNAMVLQAHVDDDTTAAETLIDFAIELASPREAATIALEAPPRARDRAIRGLVRRLPRAEVLTLLTTRNPLESSLLDELVADAGWHDARGEWIPSEVAALAHLMADHPEEAVRRTEIERILKLHPITAILTRVRHPISDDFSWDIGRLVGSLQVSKLAELIALLEDPTDERLQAAGLPDDALALNEDARVEAIAYLRKTLQYRQSPTAAPAASQRASSIAERDPAVRSIEGAAAEDGALEVLRQVFQDDGVARAVDPRTRLVSGRVLQPLREAAARGANLSAPECAQVFSFLLHWSEDDLEKWLEQEWTPDATALVEQTFTELSPEELVRAGDVLPGPWPQGLDVQVLDAADAADIRLGKRLAAATAVLARAGEDAVRTWAAQSGAPWIDPLLIRLGDCAAEERMIEGLAAQPTAIRRHPEALDEDWLSAIRCPSSTESLRRVVGSALIAGAEFHDLEAVFAALSRAAGLEGPKCWDSLIEDRNIPSGRFLIYVRRRAIEALLEAHAPAPTVDDHGLQDQVRGLVERA